MSRSASHATAGTAIDHDWRFAELVARTWTEPELAVRYHENSHAVLSEFGIELASLEQAPTLPTEPDGALVIEGVGSSGFALYTLCAQDTDRM